MTGTEVFKEAMVGASGLTAGFALFLAYHGVREYRTSGGLLWALDRLGIAIRVGLLGYLLYALPNVPVDRMSVIYAVGLTASLIGGAGLAYKAHKGEKLP